MSLNLYMGPMFSGKTTAALQLIDTYIRRKEKFLCVTSSIDIRYSNSGGKLISHDQKSYAAVAVETLLPLLNSDELLSADYIIIEEAHFFPDLKAFVLHIVEDLGKHVTCVGLNGDYMRRPFGQLLELVPYCNTITKFRAFCMMCPKNKDLREGHFTHRIARESTQTFVGGKNEYETLCRVHYLEKATL